MDTKEIVRTVKPSDEAVKLGLMLAEIGTGKRKMTGHCAVEIVKLSVLAVRYLEDKAQASANVEAKIMGDQIKQGDNAHGDPFVATWKDKKTNSKTILGLEKVLKFGALVVKAEEKPIETTAAKAEAPKLSADIPAK